LSYERLQQIVPGRNIWLHNMNKYANMSSTPSSAKTPGDRRQFLDSHQTAKIQYIQGKPAKIYHLKLGKIPFDKK